MDNFCMGFFSYSLDYKSLSHIYITYTYVVHVIYCVGNELYQSDYVVETRKRIDEVSQMVVELDGVLGARQVGFLFFYIL